MINEAMPLQYVEDRRRGRGRPVSSGRIGRMQDIVEMIAKQTIAITARHLFYLLTMWLGARQPISKTEADYDRVCSDLLALRRSGDVAWSAITDGTRIKTRWIGYGSLAEAVEEWQATYRRDILALQSDDVRGLDGITWIARDDQRGRWRVRRANARDRRVQLRVRRVGDGAGRQGRPSPAGRTSSSSTSATTTRPGD
jgi:hypothetical protein